MEKQKTLVTISVALLVAMALFSSGVSLINVGAQTSTVTIGNTTVGNSSYSFSTNKHASRFLASQNGTMQSVSVYFSSTQFNAKTAVYTDVGGKPSMLLVQSGNERISSTGWHTFTLPQNSLSQGYYWFAVVCSSHRASGRVATGNNTGQHCSKTAVYSSEFRNTFGTPTRIDSSTLSIYGTFIPTTVTPNLKCSIYWNQACSNATSSIPWGPLAMGTTKNITIYVRNEGNTKFTLQESLLNWKPSTVAAYITVSWDYKNQTLAPGSTTKIALTLAVSQNAQTAGNFTFDHIITATETNS